MRPCDNRSRHVIKQTFGLQADDGARAGRHHHPGGRHRGPAQEEARPPQEGEAGERGDGARDAARAAPAAPAALAGRGRPTA